MPELVTVKYIDRGLDRLPELVRLRAQRLVKATIFQVEANVKELISQPGGGLLYGRHRASAPGEPPTTDIGNLLNSVGTEFIDTGSSYTGVCYETAEYAQLLEDGTAKMAARPHMRPAFDKVLPFWEGGLRSLFG